MLQLMPTRLSISSGLLLAAALGLSLPAAGGEKVIKDTAEYNAYIAALNTADPAARGAALEAYLARYPNSVVKTDAIENALGAYQQSGNQAKAMEKAEQLLSADANNVRALAVVTFLERAKATGGDKAALAALPGHADKGLKAVDSWAKPEGVSPADFAKLQQQMRGIFRGAAGFAALQNKDLPGARENLTKAMELDPANLENCFQLGIAQLTMKPHDVEGFWRIARAMHLAGDNAQARKSIESFGKTRYKKFHGSDEGWDALVQSAATQTTVPAGFTVAPKGAAHKAPAGPTPAEIAVQAVQQNDPSTLSFSDWEYVLSLRDASPANTAAAEKVWAAIQTKQQDGKAKLKLSGKVLSSEGRKLEVAVSDESQKSNTADLEVTLEDENAKPPAVGEPVDVVGVLKSYVAKPFKFIMAEGELAK
jgi:tetratricopeptide (TPR) repeat protein